MRGVHWEALIGFVAAVSTLGLPTPPDLDVMLIVAAAGAMAGYPIGSYASTGVTSRRWLAAIIVAVLLATVSCATEYVILFDSNFSGIWAVWILTSLFVSFYFGLTFLMAVAGVLVDKSAKDATPTSWNTSTKYSMTTPKQPP